MQKIILACYHSLGEVSKQGESRVFFPEVFYDMCIGYPVNAKSVCMDPGEKILFFDVKSVFSEFSYLRYDFLSFPSEYTLSDSLDFLRNRRRIAGNVK